MIEGVVLSLLTALFWAISPMCFAGASRRIGSLPVVVMRAIAAGILLLVGLVPYLVLMPAARAWPTSGQTLWMGVSSLCGMVLGDALLYEAFVALGARRTTQVLMLAPVFAVLGAWLFLGEHLPGMTLAGIGVVMAGTACAVFIRNDANQREPGDVTARGLLLALVGSAFVGLGAVAARQAYEGPAMDAFVATVLRVVWAAVLLGGFLVIRREFVSSMAKLGDREVLVRFIPGVLAGPSIGMICYVTALKHTEAGVVSTLSAASPLFMLPMVWYRYKSRIGWRVAMATVAGLAGVAMICLAPK